MWARHGETFSCCALSKYILIWSPRYCTLEGFLANPSAHAFHHKTGTYTDHNISTSRRKAQRESLHWHTICHSLCLWFSLTVVSQSPPFCIRLCFHVVHQLGIDKAAKKLDTSGMQYLCINALDLSVFGRVVEGRRSGGVYVCHCSSDRCVNEEEDAHLVADANSEWPMACVDKHPKPSYMRGVLHFMIRANTFG